MSYIGLGAIDPAPAPSSATVQLAEGIARSIDPTGGSRYKTAKNAAVWGATALDQAVERFTKTQAGQITLAAGNALDVAVDIGRSIQEGKYRADASGVVDISKDAFRAVEAVVGVLDKALGDAASATLKEVMDWTKIGVTCGAGIAAAGAWGALACGLGTLAKLFNYIFDQREYLESWNVPRTLFVPNEASMPLIAADAVRLLQVLRHHYNVTSFAGLVSRLQVTEFTWLTRGYPMVPTMLGGRVVAQDNMPIPGHNLRTALQLFSFDQGTNAAAALANTRNGLAFIAGWRHGAFGEPAGRGLYRRYDWDHDVNQRAIGTGAWVARSAALTDGTLRARVAIPGVGDVGGWPGFAGAGAMLDNITVSADFRPFIVVDELINFFAAVTKRELANPVTKKALIEWYRIGQLNPTRHLYVRDLDRSGEPEAGKRYETRCWTNLARAPAACEALAGGLELGRAPFSEYLRDAGAARLMAALSFIHQQWAWSSTVAEARTDPLKLIDPINPAVLGSEMRLPVDPRQVVQSGTRWTLHPRGVEVATAGQQLSRFVEGSKHATAASSTGGLLRVSGAFDNALGYGPARTDGAYLTAMIDQREAIVQAALEKLRQARLAGAVAAGKTVVVSPTLSLVSPAFKATPTGWQLAPTTFQALATAAQKKSMVGPLLLGAAALLAFKFLK